MRKQPTFDYTVCIKLLLEKGNCLQNVPVGQKTLKIVSKSCSLVNAFEWASVPLFCSYNRSQSLCDFLSHEGMARCC